MPFSAMLDGIRVDLLGDDAEEVWQRAQAARREGRLSCKGCGENLSTRAPINKARHFFHPRRSEDCPLSGPESEAHLTAKRDVATAVRESGGWAEIEWVSPGRTFVADVLAEWSSASAAPHRVVFEIQVSSQTRDRTFERDAVREAQADATIWVLLAKPTDPDLDLQPAGWAHWSNGVPSILLAQDGASAGWWADKLDGTEPAWRPSSLTSLIHAIGTGAAFLAADREWKRGGWMTPELLAKRERRVKRQQDREEAERQARELHKKNREAFTARARVDLETIKRRLSAAGHTPRLREGGPMHGHATLVVAAGSTYAVMPAANQVWSAACRKNLADTTVVASDEADQRRLRDAGVTAVTAAAAPLPAPTPPKPSIESTTPARAAGPDPFLPSPRPTRRERRERRSAEDAERAREAAARRAKADMDHRRNHLERTATRLGLALGSIRVVGGWVCADIEGRPVVVGPTSSKPPPSLQSTAVVWCDSPTQAATLSAAGWTTITRLSEVARPGA